MNLRGVMVRKAESCEDRVPMIIECKNAEQAGRGEVMPIRRLKKYLYREQGILERVYILVGTSPSARDWKKNF